jgi:ring-1,2-phenylacetyl-CoA epoxidase subunit PaaE
MSSLKTVMTPPYRVSAGVPKNMVQVQVLRRKHLLPGVATLYLARPGTAQAPAPYLPGQFITLALPSHQGMIYRSYSLCGAGYPNRPWEITVKRAQHGAVSPYLVDLIQEGTLLYASLPQGQFTLPPNLHPGMSLVLIAAGSGITPVMGLLRALALLPPGRQPQVQLHYASRHPDQTIFLRELEALDPLGRWLRRWHYFSALGHRLTPRAVMAATHQLAPYAHWYVCGPETLKHDIFWMLRAGRIPEEQMHSEVFDSPGRQSQNTGPMMSYARLAQGQGARVRVAATGATLELRPNETLLDGLERHGYEPDFSCRAGACGTCKLRVLSGQVAAGGHALTPAERQAGYVLSCVSRPIGEVTIASAGQAPTRYGSRMVAAGGAQTRRQAAIQWMRWATVVGVFGVMLGVWHLTTHSRVGAQNVSTGPGGTAPGNSSNGDDDSANGTDNGSANGSNGFPAQNPGSNFPPPSTQSGGS